MRRFIAWLRSREIRRLQVRRAELVACLAAHRDAGRVNSHYAGELGGVNERLRQLEN